MRELDDQIKQMVQDTANYDKLTKPVCAFITFESDDGYNEALTFARKGWLKSGVDGATGEDGPKILGKEPAFVAATEPTNIIWENRHIKGINLYARATVAVLLIAVMLSFTFSFIVMAKKYAINNSATFAKLDCGIYTKGLRLDGWDDATFDNEFTRYAGLEYLVLE